MIIRRALSGGPPLPTKDQARAARRRGWNLRCNRCGGYGAILGRIDAALGCQRCGRPLGPSPSDDFCNQRCQEAWHAARTVALERYREAADYQVLSGDDRAGTGERPSDRPYDEAIGNGFVTPVRPCTRAYSTTNDLRIDLGITPQMVSRAERRLRDWEAALAQFRAAFTAHTERVIAEYDRLASAFDTLSAVAPLDDLPAFGIGQPQGIVQDPETPTPQQRALELRRTRNTGPDEPRRAPRTIGRPR